MSGNWLWDLARDVEDHGSVVRVSVASAFGSAPREAGAAMTVHATGFGGTIGGGALEHKAITTAREMLSGAGDEKVETWRRRVIDYPLGPELEQCCGGYVHLLYEVYGRSEISDFDVDASDEGMFVRPVETGSPAVLVGTRKGLPEAWPLALRGGVRDMMSGAKARRAFFVEAGERDAGWYAEPLRSDLTPLYLYGAGHVGRAVVHAFQGLPFDIRWVDTAGERFPEREDEGVVRMIAAEPQSIAASAPAGAYHVVMTYSHAIDYEICRRLLAAGDFAYLGLIGSQTKQARFAARLRDDGLSDGLIDRMNSPIGLPGLEGKEPAVIAISLAADLLLRLADQTKTEAIPELGNSA